MKIKQQHQSLIVLRFFLDILEKIENFTTLNENNDIDDNRVQEFIKNIKQAYLKHFLDGVDFKTNYAIKSLHSFIVEAFRISKQIFKPIVSIISNTDKSKFIFKFV